MFALIPYTHDVQTALAASMVPYPPVRGTAMLPTIPLVQHIVQAEGWRCVYNEPTVLRMEIPFLHHEMSGPSHTRW